MGRRSLVVVGLALVFIAVLAAGTRAALSSRHTNTARAALAAAPVQRTPSPVVAQSPESSPTAILPPRAPSRVLPAALLQPLRQALSSAAPSAFHSAEVHLPGPDGAPMTMTLLGGVVVAADSNQVLLTPNAGGAEQRFSISPSTHVVAGPGRTNGLDFAWATPVLVLTENTSRQAWAAIAESLVAPSTSSTPASAPAKPRLPSFSAPPATPTPVP